ncbi:hypothetical protein P691DRAFT_810155 [Macrolepiota fuliginosa MF-IS2]|uniref:Uncharacterized protein n=1 Tax=Macrolepiota fuliginosa MF-IS2 TaxID=1400762 RepID=A0A9P6BYS3_9AGAR|nr:hypothetical protein P691DRAFT_810155 [Macrolepiota fuliginosa MF-IS2]
MVEVRDLLQYLLAVVNDFHLAIDALQESYPLSDALQTMQQLRDAVRKQCREIEAAFLDIDECARTYSFIINAMTAEKAQANRRIAYIELRLESTLRGFRKIDSGFTVGEKYFRQAVERIGSVVQSLEPGKKLSEEPRW